MIGTIVFSTFDSKGPCGMTVNNDIDDDSATKHSDSHTTSNGILRQYAALPLVVAMVLSPPFLPHSMTSACFVASSRLLSVRLTQGFPVSSSRSRSSLLSELRISYTSESRNVGASQRVGRRLHTVRKVTVTLLIVFRPQKCKCNSN